MREFSTPSPVDVLERRSLTDDVLGQVREDPARVLFRRRPPATAPGPGGDWSDVTAIDFRTQVVAVARGLLAAGVEPGDRVGLQAGTRYEWTLVDYALWWVGAVTVPIYTSSPIGHAEWILADSAAVALIVESGAQEVAIASVRARLPALRRVWVIDNAAVDQLSHDGAGIAADEVEKRRAATTPMSLATIIYTSGTTGPPKGCPLTHGHFLAELDAVTEALADLFDPDESSTLIILPLAHVFARVIQMACVRTGTTVGHHGEVAEVAAALRSFAPTFVLAVPRVFERLYTAATQQAAVTGRSRLFDAAVTTAIRWSLAIDSGGPGPVLRVRHAVADRLVYREQRAVLGGRLRLALSSGAPMSERLGHYFRGIGVPVLEGYGLVETTASVTANLPALHQVGTVGRPLPGVTVRVADDGELLVRGPQVFDGYWGDPHAAGTLHDGWLHTGDVGEIDSEGFVRITGRRREMLVTAGGKSVAPALLEDRIRAHPLVGQCIVVGDTLPYVAALVTLDTDAAASWADTWGRSADLVELADDPDLHDEIQSAVDAANATVSSAESVRRFRVLTSQWTEESGYLTPSSTLRRARVLLDHRDEIAALYT